MLHTSLIRLDDSARAARPGDDDDPRSDAATIAHWTLVRPHAANAIDLATTDALEAAIASIEASTPPYRPRAIVLTAASRSGAEPGARDIFCAGADLGELVATVDPEPFSRRMTALLARLEALPSVVVAAIEGDVYGGGCELLTACDLRVAEAHVTFAFRHARMGLTTGWGGTTRLSRMVGIGAAKRLLLTGLPCDAAEALRIGFVERVVERGAAVSEALRIAAAVAQGGVHAVALLKVGVHDAYGARDVLAASYEREVARFSDAWANGEVAVALANRAFPRGRTA